MNKLGEFIVIGVVHLFPLPVNDGVLFLGPIAEQVLHPAVHDVVVLQQAIPWRFFGALKHLQ